MERTHCRGTFDCCMATRAAKTAEQQQTAIAERTWLLRAMSIRASMRLKGKEVLDSSPGDRVQPEPPNPGVERKRHTGPSPPVTCPGKPQVHGPALPLHCPHSSRWAWNPTLCLKEGGRRSTRLHVPNWSLRMSHWGDTATTHARHKCVSTGTQQEGLQALRRRDAFPRRELDPKKHEEREEEAGKEGQ